jgi:hypothetical protein
MQTVLAHFSEIKSNAEKIMKELGTKKEKHKKNE